MEFFNYLFISWQLNKNTGTTLSSQKQKLTQLMHKYSIPKASGDGIFPIQKVCEHDYLRVPQATLYNSVG